MTRARGAGKWIVILVVTFLASIVAAGHGVAPIGLLLVLGFGHWLPPITLAYAAIAVVVAGGWLGGRYSAGLLRLGSVLLMVSWGFFQTRSDAFLPSLPLSLPFLGASVAFFAGQLRAHESQLRLDP